MGWESGPVSFFIKNKWVFSFSSVKEVCQKCVSGDSLDNKVTGVVQNIPRMMQTANL
jgi:hypothetical protein